MVSATCICKPATLACEDRDDDGQIQLRGVRCEATDKILATEAAAYIVNDLLGCELQESLQEIQWT